MALEEQYWQHVEYFPSHEVPEMSLSANELTEIFIQGQCGMALDHLKGLELSLILLDQMTSNTSTFPYNADQCKTFIQILRALQGEL